MITFSNKDHIYIGKEAGKEIYEEIKNAKKSVKVVSPYLSPDYIKELIKLYKDGRKITLITCDKIETSSYSDFKISDLIDKEKVFDEKADKLKKQLFASFIWLFVVSSVFIMPAFIFPFLFILGGIFFFIGIAALIYSDVISPYSYNPHGVALEYF